MFSDIEMMLLLDNLENNKLEQFKKYLKDETFKKNQCIIDQNMKLNKIYMLRKGRVKTTLQDKQGGVRVRSLLLPGDSFGELAFLNDDYPICGAYAVTDVSLFSINSSEFYKTIMIHPEIQCNLLMCLMKQIQKMNMNYLNYLNNDMKGRVGLVILRIAEESGLHLNTSVTVYDIPNQRDIASLAGTSRETVSRTLSQLEKEDYIIREGKKIIIKDYKRFYKAFSL